MMHITAFIRSLRGQVKKLAKAGARGERKASLHRVIGLGLLSERVWAILYRESFSEPKRPVYSFSPAVNAHAIRRVAGANRLMEAAMEDEDYAISAKALRSLLNPTVVTKVATFEPARPEDLATAKRVSLSFYQELARVARQLGSQKVGGALDEISRAERQGLRQLLDKQVLDERMRVVG